MMMTRNTSSRFSYQVENTQKLCNSWLQRERKCQGYGHHQQAWTQNICKKWSLVKTSKWVGRLKNAHLPVHLAWKTYGHQLWSSIRYGIGTLATPRKDIEDLLHKLEFIILLYLGINKHVKTEWRQLPREFMGIGLYNLSVEQFIAWMETLLQHYGAGFTISKKLKAPLKAIQLEIGCTVNPLKEDYMTLGLLATEGWVKAVWE